MKKTLRLFGAVLCIVLLTMSLSSCDKDDDDKDSSIVGTWYVEHVYNSGTSYAYNSYSEVTYKKDGTITGYWKDTYKDGDVVIETDKGVYKVDGDLLCIWWESDKDGKPWTANFTINGNTMTTTEDGGITWIRKK